MARARGMHGERLDAAIGRVETVVVRVLRGIASRVARLVGGSPSPAALSDDDLQTIRRDWRDAVTTEIVPAVSQVFVESAETLAKSFADAGRPVEVVPLEAPAAADFLDAATNRLAAVADTLWDVARRELADGVRAGEGIEELAARLQEAGGFGLARARTIARTEVVAASNAASLAQALRLGDPSMVKEWMDSDDSRVREAHEFADGQRVPVGEPFDVGGEFLMYPGQPIGSAANVINERCGLGYSWDDADTPITAAAEVHTGAMVALRPSAADAKRLAVDGGEPADQLHCTLAYLGDAADIPPEAQQQVIDRLAALVEDAIRPDYDLPMQVEGFAIDVFNPPGTSHDDGKGRDTCIVLGLSGGDLDAVHSLVAETVAEVFAEAGLDLPEQHTPWIPHATLIYTDDVGRVTELVDRTGPVIFDAIRVAFAGNNTDIPLAPAEPAVAAADPEQGEPEHLAGVDLADSGIQVDSWADNTYSVTDPAGGGFWLDEDEANHLIDALNAVRGGEPATTVDLGPGGLEVALGDGDTVNLVPQDAAGGWTLTDGDAYDLSYWLAFWLQARGYYQRHEEAITAARRPWDPGQHPRGPDGRFIRKGLVPPKSGEAAAKSRAVPRSEPPARLPQRSGSPAAPTPATPALAPPAALGTREALARLTVPQLRQMMRDRGLKPGRARKTQLVDTLAAGNEGDSVASGGDGPELVAPVAAPASFDSRMAAAATGDAARAAAPVSIARSRSRGGLTKPERQALVDYKGALYLSANDNLRAHRGQLPDTPEYSVLAKRIANTDAAIAKSPLASDAQVHRGIKTGRAVFGDDWNRDLTGAEWTEHSYLSTTTNERLATLFADEGHRSGARMNILIPQGTPAVELSGAGGESELLLRRGLTLRVVADTGPGPNRELTVEVVPDDGAERGRRVGRGDTGVDGGRAAGGPVPDGDGLPGRGATARPGAEGAVAPDVPAADTAADTPTDVSPAERAAAAKADTRTAVEDLTIEPGGWVSLAALREQLGDRYSRDEVDAALFELRRDPDVRLVPETNQKTLTPAKRAAALNVGNQDKHLIGLVPAAEPTSDRQLRRAVLERELDEARAAGDTTRVQEILTELERRDALRARLAAPARRDAPASRPGKEMTAADRAGAVAPPPAVGVSAAFRSEIPVADAHLADGEDADANLRNHWLRGEGAVKIRWGTDGDFDRCVRQLGKYVRDPEGLCAEYHHEAVGKWPGEKNNHTSLADEGVAVNDVEVLPDGPVETEPATFQDGEHWHAVANWEDVSTGLRVFLPEALCWREPPFAFHWQWKSSAHGGTPETVHVGMTTRVERDPLGRVHAWGTLDLEDEFGLRYGRRLARGTERWVSIGLDESFKEYDIEYVYHQPDVVNLDDLDPDVLEVEEMRIGRGRIAELSGVSVPAQAEAVIEPSPLLLEEIMALTAAAGDAVDVAPAEDGAVTLTLTVDDQTHVATVTPEAAAELAAALRMPPADGEAVDIDGGALNLSRDGDDFYLDLGPEAAILTEADLPALADAVDAALGVGPEPVEEVVEVVEAPAMATRPAVLEVGGRSLAARVVGPTVEVSGVEVVVASGATETHTITIPSVPPAEWFSEPTDVTPEGALTITDEGRVFGYLAPAGVAHRSFRNRRVEVPMGNVDYSRWMGGEAIVAGGGRVVAGPITFECGHCDPSGPRDPGKRMEHYDNTCSVAAKAAIGENAHGVWIAGALEPGVSAEQVSRMLACRLSGDWAPHPEKAGMREFVAALLVPVPGFAMGRRAASTVRVQEGALVAAMVPVQLAVTDTVPAPEPNLQPVMDFMARRLGRDPGSRMDALRKRVHPND